MPPEKKSQQEESFTDIARLAEKQLIKAAPGAEHKDPQKTYTPNPELKTLRTFQGDMEETIHKKNESVVTIATAEQNKKKNPVPELVSTSKGSFVKRLRKVPNEPPTNNNVWPSGCAFERCAFEC